MTDLLPCPFCGHQPRYEQCKIEHCQLHGDPSQAVRVYCYNGQCPAMPSVRAGDVIDSGLEEAVSEATERWNKRRTGCARDPDETKVDRVIDLIAKDVRQCLEDYGADTEAARHDPEFGPSMRTLAEAIIETVGCARDQGTTQYCAEASEAIARAEKAEARFSQLMLSAADDNLLDAALAAAARMDAAEKRAEKAEAALAAARADALREAVGACTLSYQDIAEGDWGEEGRSMEAMLRRRVSALIDRPAPRQDGGD